MPDPNAEVKRGRKVALIVAAVFVVVLAAGGATVNYFYTSDEERREQEQEAAADDGQDEDRAAEETDTEQDTAGTPVDPAQAEPGDITDVASCANYDLAGLEGALSESGTISDTSYYDRTINDTDALYCNFDLGSTEIGADVEAKNDTVTAESNFELERLVMEENEDYEVTELSGLGDQAYTYQSTNDDGRRIGVNAQFGLLSVSIELDDNLDGIDTDAAAGELAGLAEQASYIYADQQ